MSHLSFASLFLTLLFTSGEEDISHLKLVGASRDMAGHAIRLVTKLEPDSEAPPREDEQESLGKVTGKVWDELCSRRILIVN